MELIELTQESSVEVSAKESLYLMMLAWILDFVDDKGCSRDEALLYKTINF